jgi:hypothetical protein
LVDPVVLFKHLFCLVLKRVEIASFNKNSFFVSGNIEEHSQEQPFSNLLVCMIMYDIAIRLKEFLFYFVI